MLLLTDKQRKNLAESWYDTPQMPTVKLFDPVGAATWYLSSIDPDDTNIAFGLCDLGMGFPEMGNVDINELDTFKGKLGLGIERDLHWQPTNGQTLTELYDEVRNAQL